MAYTALLCVLALAGSAPARVPADLTKNRQPVTGSEQPQRTGHWAEAGPNPAQGHDFRRMRLAGPFPAEVVSVIDGDTFEARVTVWLGHEVTTRVRLRGIDAAEMGSECAEEQEMAAASRAALTRMLGRRVLLGDVRFDKYGGRVLARALDETGQDVAQRMLADGYAIVYEGGRRQAWCDAVVTSRR